MAQPPQLRSLTREDYSDVPEWAGRLIDTLNPFLTDVGAALNGGLSTENYARQVESFTLTTLANPSDTFAGGRVVIKNRLRARPQSLVVSAVTRQQSSAYIPGTQVFPTPLSSSWSVYGAGFESPGYYQTADGRVHLLGLVTGGTPGPSSVVFTLPATMRPTKHLAFAVDSNNAHGRITVKATGEVVAEVGSTVYFSLSGVSFLPTSASHTVYNPLAPTSWELKQNGQIQINNIAGLAPSTTYAVTLTIE